MTFIDISEESFRCYVFPGGDTVRIENPVKINLDASRSGGHRVLDASGMSHYIPAGWIHLFWESSTPFSF